MKKLKILKQSFLLIGWIVLLTFNSCSMGARNKNQFFSGDENKRLIVMITGQLSNDNDNTWGAGIIFGIGDDSLYIATARHVVRGAKNFKVYYNPPLLNDSLPAVVSRLSLDKDLDLAVLSVKKMSEEEFPIRELLSGRLGKVSETTKVYSIGYARGEAWRPSPFSDPITNMTESEISFHSNFVIQGQSGGGLFNDRWQLVGMLTAFSQPDGLAINIEKIITTVKQWGYPVNLSQSNSHSCKLRTWLLRGGVVVGVVGAVIIIWPPPDDSFPRPVGRPSSK